MISSKIALKLYELVNVYSLISCRRYPDSATPEIPDEPDFDNAMDKFLGMW